MIRQFYDEACQHDTYLAVGSLRLDLTFLRTIFAMCHAKLAAVLLQGIPLFSDAAFLVFDLLDAGIGEILLQHEDLFLEHLRLFSEWSANCRGHHM
jgi:hypothetical protein